MSSAPAKVLSATAGCANQVAEMNGYASSRSEVVIDMGKVIRIDFTFTAPLFDAIKSIQLAGKRVIVTNLSGSTRRSSRRSA